MASVDLARLKQMSNSREPRVTAEFEALARRTPNDPDVTKCRGIHLYTQGELVRAVPVLEQALTLLPDDQEIAITLLRCYFRQGDAVRALQLSGQIVAVSPYNADAVKIQARLLNQASDVPAAMASWQRLHAIAPTDPEAPLQVARCASRLKQNDIALRYADAAIALDPERTEAWHIKVVVLLNEGRYEELVEPVPQLFLRDMERALAAFRNINAALHPIVCAKILAAFEASGKADEAIGELATTLLEDWRAASLRLELRSDDLAAARFVNAVLALRPADDNALGMLERLKQRDQVQMQRSLDAGDVDAALKHAERMLQIDPDSAAAHYALGRAMLIAGRPGEAVAPLARAVELADTNGWYWLNYARALERAKQLPIAFAYRRALDLKNRLEPVHIDEAAAALEKIHAAELARSRREIAAGALEAAWQHCAEAREAQAGSEAVARQEKLVLNALLDQLAVQFKDAPADTVDAARAYLEKDPYNRRAQIILGRALMGRREFAAALPVWERLAAQERDDAHFHLQIARCCGWLKLREHGMEAAEAALVLDPALEEAKKLFIQLQKLSS